MAFPTSPSTNDTHSYGGTSYLWNGTAWQSNGSGTGVATGGTVVTTGGYKYHKFTSSGTLVVTTPGLFEIICIGGGGGGGSFYGAGGGGAGGYVYKTGVYLASGNNRGIFSYE